MRKIHLLPTLLTLANAFVGLMAISKAIEALAWPQLFYTKIESACWLVLLGMVFDALDGKVARLMGAMSDFGGQLDSFSDALTFGVAPAVIAKVLIEHEGPLHGYQGHPRLHFLAAAAFSLMAILRLVRYNLENDNDRAGHDEFRGLPSPAAAGAVISTLLLYLLPRPELEMSEGSPTFVGTLMGNLRGNFPPEDFATAQSWMLPLLVVLLPALGLLMVSRVRYAHVFAALTSGRNTFITLVWIVFAGFLLLLAPKPVLFLAFVGYVAWGAVQSLPVFARRRAEQEARRSGAAS